MARQSSQARYVASGTRIVTPGRSASMVCASQSRFARNRARISSSQFCPPSQAAAVASTPVMPGEPSNRDGMRRPKRSFSYGLPKCMTAQRSAGMLKLLVAEVMVMVRAAISGCSDANGICVLPG